MHTLGSAEAYAAALADPEARWRRPVTLVHTWLDRLKEHYEVRRGGLQFVCLLLTDPSAQLLERLLAEAPKDTVIVGHSLDLAVKLIEARNALQHPVPSCNIQCRAVTLTPVRHRRPSVHAASR